MLAALVLVPLAIWAATSLSDDGGTEPPHVHQEVTPEQEDTIECCRLEGTDPELAGPLEEGPAF
jgi:hypothetical protein